MMRLWTIAALAALGFAAVLAVAAGHPCSPGARGIEVGGLLMGGCPARLR